MAPRINFSPKVGCWGTINNGEGLKSYLFYFVFFLPFYFGEVLFFRIHRHNFHIFQNEMEPNSFRTPNRGGPRLGRGVLYTPEGVRSSARAGVNDSRAHFLRPFYAFFRPIYGRGPGPELGTNTRLPRSPDNPPSQ